MEVYVVEAVSFWEDSEVIGVFSSKEEAESFGNGFKSDWHSCCEVEEFTLNEGWK